jgi:hypothetical protein
MRHDHRAHHIPFPAVLPDRVTGIAAYPVLKVFRRYASFRVALGFAQLPRQFARIPEQPFQPPAEGLYVWA